MEHEVKIVIGANFGDEGKGLMSHYFGLKALDEGKSPITVFHNGTA
jgi:adenylosuccinate synthase